MDARKVALGGLFLFVSNVTAVQAGLVAAETPFVVGAIGSLGLAACSLVLNSVFTTARL